MWDSSVFELWNLISLATFDALLGWMLHLPSDVVLFLLALLTSGLMVLLRPLTTNQDLLARLDSDRRRLKDLIRQAKKDKDQEALGRYRATSSQIALRKLAAEGKPLLAAIVPVALLATWALYRVEFHPPAADEEIELVVYVHAMTVNDEIIHLNRVDGLEATNGLIQTISEQPNEPSWWSWLMARLHLTTLATPEPDRTATWIIKGKAQAEPYELRIPFRDCTIERKLLIGQTTYTDAVVTKEEEQTGGANRIEFTTQIKMRPVMLFDIVPGLGDFLPGWLVGYVIIVVPLVFVLKWAFNVY
jgi:uncharacterized membrane protein (DUF106 family)